MDNRWHEMVLWVCRTLEAYTMTELWAADISVFMRLVQRAEALQAAKMAAGRT